MKCELCGKQKATTVLKTAKDGEEDELYVCKECAVAEKKRRQKKRESTRDKESKNNESHPIVSAFLSAIDDINSSIERLASEAQKEQEAPQWKELSLARVESRYLMRGFLHLEALYLIGEIEPVKRAMAAIDLNLEGFAIDGVKDSGHVYRLSHCGNLERAKRVVNSLIEQERNARVRLFEEMPRVFDDALCRALAILKNCRLLSPGELFDLLSPLRLAAIENLLEGIDLKQIEKLISKLNLTHNEENEPPDERDRLDAERADELNSRFEEVIVK